MKKMILLNKDHSIDFLKENKKISIKNIKYILIPILEYDIDAYIAIKPNKELLTFTKAIVKLQNVILKETDFDDCSEVMYIMNKVVKEITSFTELIRYLHSINKIEYSYSVINCAEMEFGNYIEFASFSIDLYKNEHLIYHTISSPKNRSGIMGGEAADKIMSASDILSDIKDLYNPIIFNSGMDKKDNQNLIIRNNQWKLIDASIKTKHGIIGISLTSSKSIYFMNIEDYNKLDIINTFFRVFQQYNMTDYIINFDIDNAMDNLLESGEYPMTGMEYSSNAGYELFDSVLPNKDLIIEDIIYTPYVFNIIPLISEYVLYHKYFRKILMSSWYECDTFDFKIPAIKYSFEKDEYITMKYLLTEIIPKLRKG